MKDASKVEVARFEATLAERPPVIQWRLDPVRRVQVAWYVDDPYPDGPHNRQKTACKWGHEYTPENTLETVDGHRQCRTCKNENRDTPRPPTPEQRKRRSEYERQRRQRHRQRLEEFAAVLTEREDNPLMAAARRIL